MATAPIKPTVPAAKFATEFKPGAVVKAMTAAAAKGEKGAPFDVPLDNIRIADNFNVRVTGTPASEERMAELVQSILANGFFRHKPLAVFVVADGDANVLYVKDGHRRFEAVQRANAAITEANAVEGAEQRPLIDTLPVVATVATSLSDMLVEMGQSNTGEPFTMYEKGLLAKRLLDENLTKEEIASKLSMTPRHLNNVLLLAAAPTKLRDMIVSDKITSTTGLKLMKDPKTAVAKATDMVKASDAKGKKTAQPKDSTVKMQSAGLDIDFASGQNLKEILQTIAGKVRELVGHNASDDAITTALGKIKVTIQTPAPVAEPKPAKDAPKTVADAKAAAAAHLGGDKAPAKKPTAKKAAAATPAPAGDAGLDGL